MKTAVTIEIDTDRLENYTDSYLAQLWHIAQANPAPIEDYTAGDLAESIGREIIRRWLKRTGPELWNHQSRHHYWANLTKYAHWDGKNWVPGQPGEPPPS